MTTIIRVKRHRGDDPVQALVLSCKRKKTEEGPLDVDYNSLKHVLNFSGTVEEKDDKIATSIVESFKNKHSDVKVHVPDIKAKQRKAWKERSDNSRFTLLSCLRSSNVIESLDNEEQGDSIKDNTVTIVDVHKENDEMVSDSNNTTDPYVYDLYSSYLETDSDLNDLYVENLLSIQPLEYELNYRIGEDDFDEVDPDEDDSNSESNWRNNYPDTESEEDQEEDDDEDRWLSSILSGFHLGKEESDISIDSEDDKYLNYTDDDKYCYYEAEDVVGKRYARYKANALKCMMNDGEDNEESEEEYIDCDDSCYRSSD